MKAFNFLLFFAGMAAAYFLINWINRDEPSAHSEPELETKKLTPEAPRFETREAITSSTPDNRRTGPTPFDAPKAGELVDDAVATTLCCQHFCYQSICFYKCP